MADLKLVPTAATFETPPGWKLVPIEPTNAMLSAAVIAWKNDPAKKSSTIYRAMVQAAPEPSGIVNRWLAARIGGVPGAGKTVDGGM